MNTPSSAAAMAAFGKGGRTDIAEWRPEDSEFWETTGKKVAYRNLWISIPALLCGFAVWGMWGIITVQMLNLGFPFTQAELFTLTAIAGIAGATMRIPSSFLIRLAGGRNVIFLTTAMLLAPALGTGIVLQHKNWPLWAFQVMALWSGVGGGNFASSMSNISTFFPKRLQGTALGLNAGLGNFGVTAMQVIIPLVMTVGLLGSFGGTPEVLLHESGWIFGKIPAGSNTWIQNAGFTWVLSLVPLAILCWFGMNNLKSISPNTGNPIVAFAKTTYLYTLAFLPSIFMLYLYLPAPTGRGLLNVWVAIPLDIILMVTLMKLAAFGPMKEGVTKQFQIFRNKHTWAMTILYIVTFGSFIGFSMALPLSMKVIFDIIHVPDANGVMTHTQANPNALPVLAYAWIGPFVGAATRPVGGWIADKLGGSIVTQMGLRGDGARRRGGWLRDDAGLPLGDARAVLLSLPRAFHGAVRRQRHRQRLDFSQHRRHLRQPASRPGAGLDISGRRLRCLRRAGGHWRADQGRHAAGGDVWFCGVLRAMPDPQLVVLPAPQRVCEEPVTFFRHCTIGASR